MSCMVSNVCIFLYSFSSLFHYSEPNQSIILLFKPSLVVFQLRSSRNFCIDIILLCIILGIAAYLYKWVLSGLPPFSSTCISWRILYEGSLTYCWTVFFVQCPKEVKACCEGYPYYVGFWFSGWCLKSCSISLNRSHPYFLLTLGLRFPFFCFFPKDNSTAACVLSIDILYITFNPL